MNDRSRIPQLILGLGLGFLLVTIAETLYVSLVANPLGVAWLAGVLTSLPFALGFLYAGKWLRGEAISTGRHARIGYWTVGGLLVFVLLTVVLLVAVSVTSGWYRGPLHLVFWIRWAATLGGGVGLLVGAVEARGIERAVQKQETRAEHARTEEDRLGYLNATLRHEVLNAANVILANADLVATDPETSDSVTERMDTIMARTREMEAVIKDVRLLLRASSGEIEGKPVDLTDLLTDEIERLEKRAEPLTVTTSMPDRAVVLADQSLQRAFANLLRNAVEHNDSETPGVEVTVTRDSERVTVRVADDGPGVPEAERDSLFDREIRYDPSHGLGLPLTESLVENCDGRIELTETGPDGTVFTVTLPRHSGAPPDSDRPAGGTATSPPAE